MQRPHCHCCGCGGPQHSLAPPPVQYCQYGHPTWPGYTPMYSLVPTHMVPPPPCYPVVSPPGYPVVSPPGPPLTGGPMVPPPGTHVVPPPPGFPGPPHVVADPTVLSNAFSNVPCNVPLPCNQAVFPPVGAPLVGAPPVGTPPVGAPPVGAPPVQSGPPPQPVPLGSSINFYVPGQNLQPGATVSETFQFQGSSGDSAPRGGAFITTVELSVDDSVVSTPVSGPEVTEISVPARKRRWSGSSQVLTVDGGPRSTSGIVVTLGGVATDSAAPGVGGSVSPPKKALKGEKHEESESAGRVVCCSLSRCTARVVRNKFPRHIRRRHLPWFAAPETACWLCARQFAYAADLRLHWAEAHKELSMADCNWTPNRWSFYFHGMNQLFCLLAREHGLVGNVAGLFQHLQNLDFADRENHISRPTTVISSGTEGLWETWAGDLGFAVVERCTIDPLNAPQGMLHWRSLYRAMLGLSDQVIQTAHLLLKSPPPALSGPPSVVTAAPPADVCESAQEPVQGEQPMATASGDSPVPTAAQVVAGVGKPGGESVAQPPPPRVPTQTPRSIPKVPPLKKQGKLNGKDFTLVPNSMLGYIVDFCQDLSFPRDSGLTDSHFHMDEAVNKFSPIKGVKKCLLSELDGRNLTAGAQVLGESFIRMQGAVTCFMLSRYPVPKVQLDYGEMTSFAGLFLCFGAHPGHVKMMKESRWDEVVTDVLQHSFLKGVVAIGEVGLDFCVDRFQVQHEAQEKFLELFLKRVRGESRLKDLPLVLHVREANPRSIRAAQRAIKILQKVGYPEQHRVYLHCFVGGFRRPTSGYLPSRGQCLVWVLSWCLGTEMYTLRLRASMRI